MRQAPESAPPEAACAGLARRAFALGYEALLLGAVLLAGSLPFVLFAQGADRIALRPLFQLYLVALAGLYFVWQWLRGGQTLAMKTWRMRLVTRSGGALDLRHALARYVFALAGTLLFGLGFVWALLDREHQFLHDRLAGTRIVNC
ncbi:MAG TPA: RDD family protein [Burkholderiales bacterium]|nr:RDD family protein [Burkholderiales bacterium]